MTTFRYGTQKMRERSAARAEVFRQVIAGLEEELLALGRELGLGESMVAKHLRSGPWERHAATAGPSASAEGAQQLGGVFCRYRCPWCHRQEKTPRHIAEGF